MKQLLCFLILLGFPLFIVAQKTKLTISDTETGASFRSLSVVNDSVIWMGGSMGTVCISTSGGKSFQCTAVEGYDSSEFRSLYAFNDQVALICNTGSPAHILRTVDGGINWELVYENTHAEAFIDGIDFWNEKEGICFGDPINGKMMVLRTEDGGNTWVELLGQSRPLLVDGEAAFAASGTSIRCYDSSKVIIATGGSLSRILVSVNKGTSWKTLLAPILQGQEGRGIFSFDFKNENEGIIVGGDYKMDSLASHHVFYTTDGGTSWNAPMVPTRGYRECVQYIDENIVLALGPAGMDVSYDSGLNWEPFSNEKKFHVVRKSRNGQMIVIAGGDGKCGQVSIGK